MQGRAGRPGSGAGGQCQRGDGLAADAAAWGVQRGSPSACSAHFRSPCPTSSSEELAQAKKAQARCQSAHPLETEKRSDSTAFESEIRVERSAAGHAHSPIAAVRRASTARSLWRKRRCQGVAARPPSAGLVVDGPSGAVRPMGASRAVRGVDATSWGSSVLTDSLVGTREAFATPSFARHPPPACMGGTGAPRRTAGLETLWRAVAAARMLVKVQNMNRGCKPGGCGIVSVDCSL